MTLPCAGSILVNMVLFFVPYTLKCASPALLLSVEGSWITTCKLNLQKLMFRERKVSLTDPPEITQRIMEESGTEPSSSQIPTNALATNFPFCGALLWFPATCPYHHKCLSPVVYLLSSCLHQLVPSSQLSSVFHQTIRESRLREEQRESSAWVLCQFYLPSLHCLPLLNRIVLYQRKLEAK